MRLTPLSAPSLVRGVDGLPEIERPLGVWLPTVAQVAY